jgi:hypothetical protein
VIKKTAGILVDPGGFFAHLAPGPAKILATTTDTTYVDPNAAGSVAVNYYYIVNAVKGLGWESANSRCVGEFDRNLSY